MTQNEKVSRTGIKRQNVSQNVQNLPNGKDVAMQQDVLYTTQINNQPRRKLCFHSKSSTRSLKS